MIRRHRAFLETGNAAQEELQSIDARLRVLQESIAGDFPLTENEVSDFCAGLAVQVLHICDLEQVAIDALRRAMQ
jgi:hypothetical protein